MNSDVLKLMCSRLLLRCPRFTTSNSHNIRAIFVATHLARLSHGRERSSSWSSSGCRTTHPQLAASIVAASFKSIKSFKRSASKVIKNPRCNYGGSVLGSFNENVSSFIHCSLVDSLQLDDTCLFVKSTLWISSTYISDFFRSASKSAVGSP